MPRGQPAQINLEEQGLYTTRQAAAFLGVSDRYVDTLVAMDKLDYSLWGRTRIFTRVELSRYRDSHPQLGLRRTANREADRIAVDAFAPGNGHDIFRADPSDPMSNDDPDDLADLDPLH